MNKNITMNKAGRPKGSKNTPKRTLDLRDYIPPKPAKKSTFKITSSQRKLLKEYNPEGLPDFRTKEWKTLSYDEKDSYIAEQLAIAKENKKVNKNQQIIGDIKYSHIHYNLEEVREYLEKKNKKVNMTEQEYFTFITNLLDIWIENCILYEKNRNRMLIDDLYSNIYNEFNKKYIRKKK